MPSAATPTPVSPQQIDAFLAAALGRGQALPWSQPWPEELEQACWDRIRFHGVAMVLLGQDPGLALWPAAVAAHIRDEARLQGLWEGSHKHLLQRIVDRLDAAGVGALLLKGSALAYLVYDDPAQRRRGDSDVLVRPQQLRQTRRVLTELGLTRLRDIHVGQESWQFDTRMGFDHAIDLHWQVSNAPFLRPVLDLDECFANPLPLPRLAPAAQTIAPVLLFLRGAINHALHRNLGYYDGDDMLFADSRMIWQLDTHLLAASFSEPEWDQLARLATDRGMAGPCLQQLRLARETFGTAIPAPVEQALAAQAHDTRVTAYLDTPSAMTRLTLDLRASRTWRERYLLLAAHVFPPDHFMASRYPGKQGWPKPLLYLYRLVDGGWSRLARPKLGRPS